MSGLSSDVASYSLLIKPSAAREIESIGQKKDRLRIVAKIRTLAHQPRGLQSEKLQGEDRYRMRVGSYRVVYSISDEDRVVVVVRVAHRKDVYR
jgi:mRNA interferase RelE/StbE